MCRLLAYIGSPIFLEPLLYKPEHSLIVQSYQPREMNSGVVNADGYGIGWYRDNIEENTEAFTYKSTLPIWNDVNLPGLSRYIQSQCILAYVRSATSGQALDFSNCQPFQHQHLLFTHNGYIEKFRKTLYRPIRDQLNDEIYQWLSGTTDSEHIFALLLNQLQANPGKTIEQALHTTLLDLVGMTRNYNTSVLANLVVSDGNKLVAARFASKSPAPTLYWLQDAVNFPRSLIIASEPLFSANWVSFPENSIMSVGNDFDIRVEKI
jgi:glutamine amidotransferase